MLKSQVNPNPKSLSKYYREAVQGQLNAEILFQVGREGTKGHSFEAQFKMVNEIYVSPESERGSVQVDAGLSSVEPNLFTGAQNPRKVING
ncbi:hypothetical protein FGG08_005334 [Glutinoglossum americanum]|uniref:Uncharacterized protein n=1 Tax=Glutinoglossum americanum TaxID=1670608 RepID=A0A9P8I394_9PEZI|nr:hypothetical protein FGG08_005334 [Glutinoglossum americanum]